MKMIEYRWDIMENGGFGIHGKWPENWADLDPCFFDEVYVQPAVQQLRQYAQHKRETADSAKG